MMCSWCRRWCCWWWWWWWERLHCNDNVSLCERWWISVTPPVVQSLSESIYTYEDVLDALWLRCVTVGCSAIDRCRWTEDKTLPHCQYGVRNVCKSILVVFISAVLNIDWYARYASYIRSTVALDFLVRFECSVRSTFPMRPYTQTQTVSFGGVRRQEEIGVALAQARAWRHVENAGIYMYISVNVWVAVFDDIQRHSEQRLS